MWISIFEDEHAGRLSPITLGRPAYSITCGSYQLLDWVLQLGHPVQGTVRPHLRLLQKIDYSELEQDDPPADGPRLLINARVVPSRKVFDALRQLRDEPRDVVVRFENEIAVVMVSAGTLRQLADFRKVEEPSKLIGMLDLTTFETMDSGLPLFRYPHDVVRYNMEILRDNLEYRIASGEYQQTADGVFLAPGATMGEHAVTETGDGPLLLDRDAAVGPFCLLRGPAYIGSRAKLNEHAAIKDHVSVGHTTKIGGEVEASVIEAYSNKQHHGFLGHSYLGSWINLGAGTCNSDLKNTYGIVNMEYPGEKVSTGMQFLGCVMGDYSKTAINTGLFTGKLIGACSMLYGFVTTNVPSFVNYARLFGQVTELPPEVMISTQERMFRRRRVEQRDCDIQLIRDMYELTSQDRQLAGDPLAL